jgi:hypothetical protein
MGFPWFIVSISTIAIDRGCAQSIGDVPQCAVSWIVLTCRAMLTLFFLQKEAAFSSISSTGCQITDVNCICKDQSFINSLLPVVEKKCNPADLQSNYVSKSQTLTKVSNKDKETVAFTKNLCDSVDVTITVSAFTFTDTTISTPAPSNVVSNQTVSFGRRLMDE